MDAAGIVDKVLESGYRLARIETGQPERLVAVFRRLPQESGRSVYHWRPGCGLSRLAVEPILIPRTQTPPDAIAYIRASRHPGVYLLEGFGGALERPSIAGQLAEFATGEEVAGVLILLIGEYLPLPEALRPQVATIRQNPRPSRRNGTSPAG
ncbi:MAG: hypothetical protein U5L11_07775 [Arhodomonas sp.]|nr:hypothetical protein [Arhodomonas sp.]